MVTLIGKRSFRKSMVGDESFYSRIDPGAKTEPTFIPANDQTKRGGQLPEIIVGVAFDRSIDIQTSHKRNRIMTELEKGNVLSDDMAGVGTGVVLQLFEDEGKGCEQIVGWKVLFLCQEKRVDQLLRSDGWRVNALVWSSNFYWESSSV